ncbi:ROK family protein, partial [Chloroflexota bacterium]
IGSGIIIDGNLYRGVCGTAGEVGHITIDLDGPRCNCGNAGCWETLASGTALARRARQRIEQGAKTSILPLVGGHIDGITAETVALAASKGDQFAKKLITENGYYLGVGFVNLVNLFNPELILIGGGLSHIGEALLKPAIEVVKERAFKAAYESVRFALAKNIDDAGLLGAIALVMERIKERDLSGGGGKAL